MKFTGRPQGLRRANRVGRNGKRKKRKKRDGPRPIGVVTGPPPLLPGNFLVSLAAPATPGAPSGAKTAPLSVSYGRTLSEISQIVSAWVDHYGVGGTNYYGGNSGWVIDDEGNVVARVSYNGRVWEPSKHGDKEITGELLQLGPDEFRRYLRGKGRENPEGDDLTSPQSQRMLNIARSLAKGQGRDGWPMPGSKHPGDQRVIDNLVKKGLLRETSFFGVPYYTVTDTGMKYVRELWKALGYITESGQGTLFGIDYPRGNPDAAFELGDRVRFVMKTGQFVDEYVQSLIPYGSTGTVITVWPRPGYEISWDHGPTHRHTVDNLQRIPGTGREKLRRNPAWTPPEGERRHAAALYLAILDTMGDPSSPRAFGGPATSRQGLMRVYAAHAPDLGLDDIYEFDEFLSNLEELKDPKAPAWKQVPDWIMQLPDQPPRRSNPGLAILNPLPDHLQTFAREQQLRGPELEEFNQAVAKYCEFHGVTPEEITIEQIGETEGDQTKFLVGMGATEDVSYSANHKGIYRGSNKRGVPFRHEFPSKPHMATTPDGDMILIVNRSGGGKRFAVSDWIRG